jgi:hypothetical protein
MKLRHFNRQLYLLFCISLLYVILASTAGCKKTSINKSTFPKEVNIEYRISTVAGTSTELSNGAYTNATGGNNFFDNSPLPYLMKVKRTVEQGEAIAIAFTDKNDNSNSVSTIKCDIIVNGETVASKSFSGQSPILGSLAYVFR